MEKRMKHYMGIKMKNVMPQWLVSSLKTQKLTTDEVNAVLKKVSDTGKAHDIQAARIEPTEEDLKQRFNI